MSAKESQKVKTEGYGTDNPNNGTNIVNQGKAGHKVPALGAIGVVPDIDSPEKTRGGKN